MTGQVLVVGASYQPARLPGPLRPRLGPGLR